MESKLNRIKRKSNLNSEVSIKLDLQEDIVKLRSERNALKASLADTQEEYLKCTDTLEALGEEITSQEIHLLKIKHEEYNILNEYNLIDEGASTTFKDLAHWYSLAVKQGKYKRGELGVGDGEGLIEISYIAQVLKETPYIVLSSRELFDEACINGDEGLEDVIDAKGKNEVDGLISKKAGNLSWYRQFYDTAEEAFYRASAHIKGIK